MTKVARLDRRVPEEWERRYLKTVWPEVLERDPERCGWPALDDYDVEYLYAEDWPEVCSKTALLASLGEPCGKHQGGKPHPPPPEGTAFVAKPDWNREGLASGARLVSPWTPRYEHPVRPGEMWQEFHQGSHHSVDCALRDGEIMWLVAAEGLPAVRFGQFLAWRVDPWWRFDQKTMESIVKAVAGSSILGDFTGVVNLEFILPWTGDGKPRYVDVHLRPSTEFGPLYGAAARRALTFAGTGHVSEVRPVVQGGSVHVSARDDSPLGVRADDVGEVSWREAVTYCPSPQPQ